MYKTLIGILFGNAKQPCFVQFLFLMLKTLNVIYCIFYCEKKDNPMTAMLIIENCGGDGEDEDDDTKNV